MFIVTTLERDDRGEYPVQIPFDYVTIHSTGALLAYSGDSIDQIFAPGQWTLVLREKP